MSLNGEIDFLFNLWVLVLLNLCVLNMGQLQVLLKAT